MDSQPQKPVSIAIVGGGIGGIALTIGLLRRGIDVQVYEARGAHAEVGAGICFGPNSIRAMALIDPAIRILFDGLATKNGTPGEEEMFIQFRSGFGDLEEIVKIKTADERKTGLSSVHRAEFLNAMAKLVPDNIIHFAKRLKNIMEGESGLTLVFEDESIAIADAVIGCDGIKSRVRQMVLGNRTLTEDCYFSGKIAFRCLIPMTEAKEMVGDNLAGNSQMYLGPGGFIRTYPIDHGKTLNVVALLSKEGAKWENPEWVLPDKKKELLVSFKDFAPPVQNILKMMESPAIWALFDHSPAASYYKGQIAMLGDAAHASTPHLSAGAGQVYPRMEICTEFETIKKALEDALVMSEVLANEQVTAPKEIPKAFRAYDAVRRPRSQQVVTSSRAAGELYAFQGPAGSDIELIRAVIPEAYQWIWENNLDEQLEKARAYLSSENTSTS